MRVPKHEEHCARCAREPCTPGNHVSEPDGSKQSERRERTVQRSAALLDAVLVGGVVVYLRNVRGDVVGGAKHRGGAKHQRPSVVAELLRQRWGVVVVRVLSRAGWARRLRAVARRLKQRLLRGGLQHCRGAREGSRHSAYVSSPADG